MPTGMTGGVLLILVAAAAASYGIGKAVKPVEKFNHKVCNVVTLGHKCKPHPQSAPTPTQKEEQR